MRSNLLIIQGNMQGGGAEKVLSTVLNNINYNRFNITLLLIYKEGVYLDRIPADVEVLGVFRTKQSKRQKIINKISKLYNYLTLRRARKLLAGRKFDVTISFMEGTPAKLHSQLMDIAPRNISWVHSNLNDRNWYCHKFKLEDEQNFYKNLDKVAVVSNDALAVFQKLYPTNAEVEVIYNPIDSKDVVNRAGEYCKIDDKSFTIVNVGRLIEVKRQDRLIQAAAILKKRGFNIVVNILGTGPLEEQLKKFADDLNVKDCVNFVGFKSNPYPWIKNSDVFCLTSRSEGYSLVVAEALILNIPVISTRVTGPIELLAKGGGIFTGESPESIADNIALLIKDKTELKRLKEESAKAAKQFSIEKVMNQISDFIIN